MKLKINNQEKQYDQNELSVQQLLDIEIPHAQNGIAIAINDNIVSKSHWASTPVQENADVLIIKATQGG